MKVIFNFKPNKQCEVFVYTISEIQSPHMCSLIHRGVLQQDDHLSQSVSTMIIESLELHLQSSRMWQQVTGYKFTNTLKEPDSFIFKLEDMKAIQNKHSITH
jgi:hypothetical protein